MEDMILLCKWIVIGMIFLYVVLYLFWDTFMIVILAHVGLFIYITAFFYYFIICLVIIYLLLLLLFIIL